MTEVQRKPIEGFDGYEIDSEGGVWSSRVGGTFKRLKPKRMGNYLGVALRKDGNHHYRYIHRLVLEAFVGRPPEGAEACHYPDPDRANHRLANLHWGTRQTNAMQCIEMGRWQPIPAQGSQNGRAILDEAKVAEMRRLRAKDGLSYRVLATRFGVSKSAVASIFRGVHWKGVG